jgi:polysaccharide pyruvyl transferase WcaK-like protein
MIKKNKMKNIRTALVGLYNCNNLGDPILAKCTEWLYCNCGDSIQISKRLSLDILNIILKKEQSLIYRICVFLKLRFGYSKFYEKYLSFFTYKYYLRELQDVDVVIIVGGGLIKYKAQNFWLFLPSVIKAAEKLKKKVIINAVGVEGYDRYDYRCQKLKRALHSHCILQISTRDDYNTLVSSYFDGNPQIDCVNVADPAVWTSECYNMKRNKDISTGIIGLGIARGEIFIDHGIDVSSEAIKKIYCSIAINLIKMGYTVEIYSNGASCDSSMVSEVFRYVCDLGYSNIRSRIPQTDVDLIEMISSYDAIIATRLHSCIIAYSLEIPAIGLVWNDKLKLFGEKIGSPSYFITHENFNETLIINKLQEAMTRGYEKNIRDNFRKTIKDNVDLIIKKLNS